MIYCTTTDEMYVGGTTKWLARRMAQHRWSLRNGRHPSKMLQAAWDRYGEHAFQFNTLAKCAAEDVRRIEQKFIDALQPAFNTEMVATTGPGARFRVGAELLTLRQVHERYGTAYSVLYSRARLGYEGVDLVGANRMMH